jgi:hypothetical protein
MRRLALSVLVVAGACGHAEPAPVIRSSTVVERPGYSAEIVPKGAHSAILVAHVPCGDTTCDRSPWGTADFKTGRILGLIDIEGEPLSLSPDLDENELPATLSAGAGHPVAVIARTDPDAVALELVDLVIDPPETIFYEVIARQNDHHAAVFATGRIELVRDGDSPDGLAVRITFETHVAPNGPGAGMVFEPIHARWIYAEGKYWRED